MGIPPNLHQLSEILKIKDNYYYLGHILGMSKLKFYVLAYGVTFDVITLTFDIPVWCYGSKTDDILMQTLYIQNCDIFVKLGIGIH